MSKILCVGLSPTLQSTISFSHLALDAVNRSQGYRIDASGKAFNAARVLGQLELGCVTNICPLGRDNAAFFLELAERDSLPVIPVYTSGRVRSCSTLIEPGSGITTELVVGEPVGTDDYVSLSQDLVAAVKIEASNAKGFLFAGSRPAFWPEDLCARLCSAAHEEGLIVMADFHGPDLLRTLNSVVPDIIKINEEEFCETFGYSFPLTESELILGIVNKSKELHTFIVITRGSSDTFAAYCGEFFCQKVTPIIALNSIGCGDSFTAGCLHSWLLHKSVPEALAEGSRCATRNALNIRPGSIKDPGEEGEQLW